MTKAAELAKMGEVITNSQIGGRRNIIKNGNFQCWQRSTSETGLGASAGYFTADRWRISTGNSAGRFTMNRTAGDPDGFNYGLVINCTTADTSIAANETMLIQQKIEGQDLQQLKKGTSSAEPVTISFYAKIVGSATDFAVTLYDSDNSRFISKLFTFTTDWVRYYWTVPGDTTGTLDQDANSSLQLWFWLHAGSDHTSGTLQTSWGSDTNANRAVGIDSIYSSTDNEFYLAGVQMEVSSQATNFEHRSFGEELALCQRYLVKFTSTGVYQDFALVSCYSTNAGRAIFDMPTDMRANPTFSTSGAFQILGGGTVTGSSFVSRHGNVISINLTGSISGTNAPCGVLRNNNDADASLTFDAEL
tara:strand:+ start:1453 stop:2535 length:1083 start_codon:yes stop_codon:yes gene_type:complete